MGEGPEVYGPARITSAITFAICAEAARLEALGVVMALYHLSWQFKDTSEEGLKRGLAAFSAWEPPEGQQFVGFYGNADSSGGVAIIEADSHETIARATSPFAPWATFAATPIVPIETTAAVGAEGVAFRESVS
jgi:hypothetical protein